MFAAHQYGPSVFQQDYFTTDDYPTNLPAIWDLHWASVPAHTGVPVVVTEWGGWFAANSSSVPSHLRPPGYAPPFSVSDEVWQEAFLSFILDRGIGSFYWSLNPDSRDTGGLLGAQWQREGPSALSSRKMQLLSRVRATRVFSLVDGLPPIAPPNPPTPPPPPPPPPPLSSVRIMWAWLASVVVPLLLLFWMWMAYQFQGAFALMPGDSASLTATPVATKQAPKQAPVDHLVAQSVAIDCPLPTGRTDGGSTPRAIASSGTLTRSSTFFRGLLNRPNSGDVSSQILPTAAATISRPSQAGRFYQEARPVRLCQGAQPAPYFSQSSVGSTACVVCLYNEQAHELSRTLGSLTSAAPNEPVGGAEQRPRLDILVVADGLEKLDSSMRGYLQRTFHRERQRASNLHTTACPQPPAGSLPSIVCVRSENRCYPWQWRLPSSTSRRGHRRTKRSSLRPSSWAAAEQICCSSASTTRRSTHVKRAGLEIE